MGRGINDSGTDVTTTPVTKPVNCKSNNELSAIRWQQGNLGRDIREEHMPERTETMPNPTATFKRNEVIPSMASIGRSSWSAIFAGTVVALITDITLVLLGAGIGLSSIGASPTAGTLQGVGTGAMMWAAITGIVAMFIGGWVTSRFAGMQRAFDGALHGLVTWGLTSMIMLFMLTTVIGAAVSGGFNVLGGITNTSSQVYSALPPQMRQQVQGAVRQGAQAGQQQVGRAQSTGQLQETAQNVGVQAAKVTSSAAWGGFFILLLGGVAAGVGGTVGRIKGPVAI